MFRVLIRRLDLSTPGRERSEEDAVSSGFATPGDSAGRDTAVRDTDARDTAARDTDGRVTAPEAKPPRT